MPYILLTGIRVWEERCQARLGYWRSVVNEVIYKYLECGDPHLGFARVKCVDCNHEYLLAFSCQCRHFCPYCHQKRVVEFGQWLYTAVLKKVPHRQWVFSIPCLNPHLHIIATDGCFYNQDGFMIGPQPDPKALEHAFRLEVLKMHKKRRQAHRCRYRQYA